MAKPEAVQRPLLRDQRRALHAYEAAGNVGKDERDDYQAAVNDLGANILRGGLCASLAAIQRLGKRGELLLSHLAAASRSTFCFDPTM